MLVSLTVYLWEWLSDFQLEVVMVAATGSGKVAAMVLMTFESMV
jgi:hypothetical protein